MTPEQLAKLVIGIAEAQAAIIEAISATLENGQGMPQLKQAVDRKLSALQGGANKRPITLETLPAQALRSALAPSSSAGRSLQQTTLAEVQKLLQEPKP